MNNITIQQKTINQQVQNTVNARNLWIQLESKREFANWIKDRLVDFIDGIDFLTISSKTSGRPAIDYYLTIETAKHLK
jgi:anti-repressor protein